MASTEEERAALRRLDACKHRTVLVAHGGEEAQIDEDLAPLVLETWRAGIRTTGSCQNLGESLDRAARWFPHLRAHVDLQRGKARIDFRELDDVAAFVEAVANAGPRDDLYERMFHWASPGAWEKSVDVYDWQVEELEDGDDGEADWSLPSRVEIGGSGLVFPQEDIPELVRRMRRHNRGEIGDLGEPTWDTISLPDNWAEQVLNDAEE